MIGRSDAILEERRRIEHVVADKFVGVAVELIGARLGLHFDRAGTVLAVLCAVVGSENFEFADGVDAGSHVQRAIAAVVEVVAAIEFPVVVFDAAAVDAE